MDRRARIMLSRTARKYAAPSIRIAARDAHATRQTFRFGRRKACAMSALAIIIHRTSENPMDNVLPAARFPGDHSRSLPGMTQGSRSPALSHSFQAGNDIIVAI
jgi:hypothetical protein